MTVEKIDAATNTHKRQLTIWKYINYHKNHGNVAFIRKLVVTNVPVQKSLLQFEEQFLLFVMIVYI